MSVLLDTHVWIWWLTGQEELPTKERIRLDRAAEEEPPFLSDISLWEAQMMHAKGKLKLEIPFAQWLIEATLPDVVQLARITPNVVLKLDSLPGSFHGDPADRIIVATALAQDVPVHTHDRKIRQTRLVKLWKP